MEVEYHSGNYWVVVVDGIKLHYVYESAPEVGLDEPEIMLMEARFAHPRTDKSGWPLERPTGDEIEAAWEQVVRAAGVVSGRINFFRDSRICMGPELDYYGYGPVSSPHGESSLQEARRRLRQSGERPYSA